MKKIKYIIGIVILIIISCMAVVYADYLYDSSNVEYNNSNSTLNSTSVQGAIDELYEKVSNIPTDGCPSGYIKNVVDQYEFMCVDTNKPIQSPICKRATTLHTETCTNSNTSYYCGSAGYAANGTITYGNLGTTGSAPSPGDAFDCDVTGNGDWERFYYVGPYYDTNDNAFDGDYYTFIYNSDTIYGVAGTSNVAWASSNSNSSGPVTLISQLPTTNQWRDDLLKSEKRNILSKDGTLKMSNFSYEGYAARLLTYQEVQSGCPTATQTKGTMKNCNYFFENSKFSDASKINWGFWLETVNSTTSAYSVSAYYVSIDLWNVNQTSFNGVRPVIEIHKDLVSY